MLKVEYILGLGVGAGATILSHFGVCAWYIGILGSEIVMRM